MIHIMSCTASSFKNPLKRITLGLFGLVSLYSALLATSANAASPHTFEDSMAQRTLACTACHGPQGRAAPDGFYPRLAGKPAGYLYNQLINFRDGRRNYALMSQLINPLSDAYLLEIAQYFSALDIPYPAPLPASGSQALRNIGQQLVLNGDKARQIPACVQCHGQAMTGVAPNIPGLLGLPRDYLNSQLGAWKTGQRKAHAPDCMKHVVERLNTNDINAIGSWLAAQPLPLNTHAVSQRPALPAGEKAIECGSAPLAAALSATPTTAGEVLNVKASMAVKAKP
jgi:cytochrome c553